MATDNHMIDGSLAAKACDVTKKYKLARAHKLAIVHPPCTQAVAKSASGAERTRGHIHYSKACVVVFNGCLPL